MKALPTHFAATLLALATLPAAARAAEAQINHENLIVIQVGKVIIPANLPGPCRVEGVVSQVIEGPTYHAGQPIWLDVPCTRHSALDFRPAPGTRIPSPGIPNPPPAAAEFYGLDPVLLRGSKVGAARLDDRGNLIWDARVSPLRPAAPYDGVMGYRMLDGPRLAPAGEMTKPL